MKVDIVDPPAFTPPYDRCLSAALAASPAAPEVRLVTSEFAYGDVPVADGYSVSESFYRHVAGAPGSRLRRLTRLASHVPEMLRYRADARDRDIVHFQWLTVQPLDQHLIPRRMPVVITAHDVLPREPRPGQLRAQRRLYEKADAVVVHSQHGLRRLEQIGVDRARVIPHGAFTHLAALEPQIPLELSDDGRPVVAMVGLLRQYKGLDVLYRAWEARRPDCQLWVCGMPRMRLPPAPDGAQVVARFLRDSELAGVLRRADLVVMPYREIDQSGILFAALGLARPLLLSAVGGFPEIADLGAAVTVAPGDPVALGDAICRLMADRDGRQRLAQAAASAAAGPLSWKAAAAAHLELYEDLLR